MKTVSLELAKELKTNGYPQETHSWWDFNGIKDTYELVCEAELPSDYSQDFNYAAPTADEILDRLPASIMTEEDKYELGLEMRRVGKFWEINYADIEDVDNGGFHNLNGVSDTSLADAAAKMWLYLKEKELMPVS